MVTRSTTVSKVIGASTLEGRMEVGILSISGRDKEIG